MEKSPCSCCGHSLSVIGSRKRVWYKSTAERCWLIIRRLQCKECKKIHHELPDILIPYKRYDADSIEKVIVIEPMENDVAVEDLTIYRWKNWFYSWISYAIGCLQSISMRLNRSVVNMSDPSHTVLQSIGQFVGNASGWLRRIVRPIANSNLWVTDPFCIFGQTSFE